MCDTPLIEFPSGDATVSSTTLADAPGYTALTVTTGGAISGYCEIGRLRIAERPASTRNTEITAAKIGRSIKKRENIFGCPRATSAPAAKRPAPWHQAPLHRAPWLRGL